jgi:hypothetical protein
MFRSYCRNISLNTGKAVLDPKPDFRGKILILYGPSRGAPHFVGKFQYCDLREG